MPRRRQNLDFTIHVDEPFLNTPMDEETPTPVEQRLVLHGSTFDATAHVNDKDEAEKTTEQESREDATADDSLVDGDDEDTPRSTQIGDDLDDDDGTTSSTAASSRRSSTQPRRTSLRTEALIQAAARAVVAQIERSRGSHGQTGGEAEDTDDGDLSLLSTTTDGQEPDGDGETVQEGTDGGIEKDGASQSSGLTSPSHQQPRASEGHMLPTPDTSTLSATGSVTAPAGEDHTAEQGDEHVDDPAVAEADEEAENTGDGDDIFSDRSPRSRSSLGSVGSGKSSVVKRKPGDADQQQPSKLQPKSPPYPTDEVLSDASSHGVEETAAAPDGSRIAPRISDISQYERAYAAATEEFVPTPPAARMPFRTPSAVRALQMSSPPQSVFSVPQSPRGAKAGRLGSPKGRGGTPGRFRRGARLPPPEPAPLVLLHVTLLPLRWAWADVVAGVTPSAKEDTDADPLVSDKVKTLREAWRLLVDRMGDTVLERGILLPHPQNDYEVLEERLLEAMELPLRRRARILECGHYLGPANEMNIVEDDDEEDTGGQTGAYSVYAGREAKHWCATCKGDVKLESLGPGKVYRIKVYASNGLMKAGAWAACWREMERVDVEVVPILEPDVQDELERIAARQHQERMEREAAEAADEEHSEDDEHHHIDPAAMLSSPPMGPNSAKANQGAMMSPQTTAEDRRRRDAERLREIYGHTPPPATSSPMHNPYILTSAATAGSPPEDADGRPMTSGGTTQRHIPPSTGGGPATAPMPAAGDTPGHPDSYIPPPSPPSPSEEAFERRERRRSFGAQGGRPYHGGPQGYYQTASLPELLWESARVLLRDRKNSVIAALCFLVLVLALRNAPPQPPAPGLHVQQVGHQPLTTAPSSVDMLGGQEAHRQQVALGVPGVQQAVDTTVVVVTHTATVGSVDATAATAPPAAVVKSVEPVEARQPVQQQVRKLPEADDEVQPGTDKTGTDDRPETVTEKKVVRVYETVTETETVKVTATQVVEVAAAGSSNLPHDEL